MKIGLFFGSFNPIHIGHLIIAESIINNTDIDQVWFVVSPHNPHKDKKTLLADHHRLEMVRIAIEENSKFKASDIEFKMPQPSYTIHTLMHLIEKHPNHQFALIMGEDNLESFHKWKNYNEILKNAEIYVYPRPNCNVQTQIPHKKIDAPLIEISSSLIRKNIKEKKSYQYLVPRGVFKYIDEMNFYKP